MAPPSHGKLVALDPALLVSPPAGMEAGYVPIVTRQSVRVPDLSKIVTPEMLAGRYQCEPALNGWHVGELKIEGSPGAPSYRWTNSAGVTWKLTADLAHARLECEKGSPYFKQESGKSFRIEMRLGSGAAIAGFQFNGAFYKRVESQPEPVKPRANE